MDTSGRRWWWVTALVAVLAAAGAQVALRSRPERRAPGFVPVDTPHGWDALPVVARIEGEATAPRDSDGCGYNEYVDHTGRLGRFSVGWTDWVYKGRGAGSGAFRVSAPDLEGRFPLERPSLQGPGPSHPDTLREDAPGGIYVLEARGVPMGAFRIAPVVIAPPFEASTFSRLASAVVAAAITLGLSFAWRRREA